MRQKQIVLVGAMIASLFGVGCVGLDLALCCLSCATGGVVSAEPGIGQGLQEQGPDYLKKIQDSKPSKSSGVKF